MTMKKNNTPTSSSSRRVRRTIILRSRSSTTTTTTTMMLRRKNNVCSDLSGCLLRRGARRLRADIIIDRSGVRDTIRDHDPARGRATERGPSLVHPRTNKIVKNLKLDRTSEARGGHQHPNDEPAGTTSGGVSSSFFSNVMGRQGWQTADDEPSRRLLLSD